jgi:AcrR family transcriptional regulator
VTDDRTTKQRLIDEGMRLFAERGFRGISVGEIETAAGLTPRAGGMYKHFPSKRALLEAAVERHIGELRSIGSVIELLPLGDLRAELTLLLRWLFGELVHQREICLVLEKDGRRLPDLRDRFFSEVVDAGYRQGAEFAQRRLKALPGADHFDAEAIAAAAVGAVVNFKRTEWTFGYTPLDLDEDRLVAGLVDLLCEAAARYESTGDD